MSQVTRTPASTPARTTSGNLIPTSTVPRGGTSSDTKTSGYTSTVTSTIRNGNGGSSFGSGSSSKSLSKNAIIGIAVGVAVFTIICLIAALLVFLYWKRSKKRKAAAGVQSPSAPQVPFNQNGYTETKGVNEATPVGAHGTGGQV